MLECAPVRLPHIVVLFALAALAAGDTIYLKNGRTITAEEVTEQGGKVFYHRGEDTYAIPKALVERVEKNSLTAAPAGAESASSRRGEEVAGFALSGTVPGMDAAPSVVRDGRIDANVLSELARSGRPEAVAAAYFTAGRHESEHGDRERACYYLERAAAQLPQNTSILNQYAALLVQLGRAQDAIPIAERSTRLAASDADGHIVLGFAYYNASRTRDAVAEWKRALQLRSDAGVQKLLAKAEREASTEADFQQSETGHFVLSYEGASTSALLRQQIEQALEESYNELVLELGIAPRNTIQVSLYNNQSFFDVTQAPSWIGALNDGKLRIPIQGVREMTPALRRVLKHELAHSFINQAARGRCPQWLNEGIAQLVEPRSVGSSGRRLAQLYSVQRQIPLNTLESSFMNFSTPEAALVYEQSLAAAEYIRDTYTMGQLRTILERLAEGGSAESALRSTIHSDYSQLENELGRYLARKYGN